MHSTIFQITTEQVPENRHLNPLTIEFIDEVYTDWLYCKKIDDEKRKTDINILVNKVLPKGMFELISEDTIRYNGGADKWKAGFVSAIQQRVNALTSDNIMEWWDEIYQIKEFMKNPLNTSYLFYDDEQGRSAEAKQSYRFLRFVFGLEPGTLLYIGGMVDYHL